MTPLPTSVTLTPQTNALLLSWGVNETAGLIGFKVLWRAVGVAGWQWAILDAYQRQHAIGELDPTVEYEAKVETAVYAGASPAVKAKPLSESPPPPVVPVNTVPPIITGTPEVGVVLTAAPGKWTGEPTGYSYQWFLSGVLIVGATESTYAIPHTVGEAGHTIDVQVVASNKAGASLPALSAETAPIVEHEPPPTGGTWRGFGPVVPASFDPWGTGSFINQRVPANPTVLSNSSALCGFVSHSDVWTDGGYDHPVYFAKETDPLVTVEGVLYPSTGFNGEQIRCPANAHPAPGSDHHMVVVQPDGSVRGFWSVQNNGPSGGKLVAHGAGYSKSFAESLGVSERADGATASGMEPACGTVRIEELEAGVIPHGLFIPCRESDGWQPPAKGSDGHNGSAPKQGQRFYLAYTDAEIAAAPWPRWKKTIITAMAHYGLWCGDSGGGFVKFWGQQSYSAYTGKNPFNDYLEKEPASSFGRATGLGGPALILHLNEGVDWTRLRAIA